MRSEAALQSKVIKKIKERYGSLAKVYKIHDQCSVGIPDLLICFMGRFCAIELKKDKACLATRKQLYEISEIHKAGGLAAVMCSVEEVIEHLDKVRGAYYAAGNR